MSIVSGPASLSSHRPVWPARRSGAAGLQSTPTLAASMVGSTPATHDLLYCQDSWRHSSSFSPPVSIAGRTCIRPRAAKALAYAGGAQTTSSPLQKATNGSQEKMSLAAVRLLSKAELRQELELRDLSSQGLKDELRKRLFAATGANPPGDESAQPSKASKASKTGPQQHNASGSALETAAPTSNGSTRTAMPAQQDLQAAITQDLHNRLPDQAAQSSAHANGTAHAAASSSQHSDTLSSSASAQREARQNDGDGFSDQADSSGSDMCVTWLGTASGAPSLRRNVSCIALCFGSATYLVDCGEGSSRQVTRANIDPTSIQGLFISHLHGDHCFGLPGVIELVNEAHRLANTPFVARTLRVYGPPGIQQLVQSALSAGSTDMHIKLLVTEFTLQESAAESATREGSGLDLLWLARQAPDGASVQRAPPDSRHLLKQGRTERDYAPVVPGLVWSLQSGQGVPLAVHAAQLQHRLPCWGYVFTELSSQGQAGRKVVLLGDTCDSHAIAELAMGADMVSHEATFAAGMEKKAYTAQHSTAPMAGAFARRVRAQALVLTHFSNRYSKRGDMRGRADRGESEGDSKEVLKLLINQAKATFGSDRVWAAEDFYTFQVKQPHLSETRTRLHEQKVGAWG